MYLIFQQSGEETLTRRVRRLLATDTAEDEKGYSNNGTLLYAPTMNVTIEGLRYSSYVS
jgi:hypothetical protein